MNHQRRTPTTSQLGKWPDKWKRKTMVFIAMAGVYKACAAPQETTGQGSWLSGTIIRRLLVRSFFPESPAIFERFFYPAHSAAISSNESSRPTNHHMNHGVSMRRTSFPLAKSMSTEMIGFKF